MTYLCIAPACGDDCCQCNYAISPQQQRKYAIRYAYLRGRPLDAIALARGGVFAGKVPDNLVLNEEDLDAAIDAALATSVSENAHPPVQPHDTDLIVAWFKPAEGRRGAAVHVRKVDAPDWQASRDAAYVADGWQPLASLVSARALGDRWIPVTERMPEKFEEVLIAFRDCALPATGQYTASPHDTWGWAFPSENDPEDTGPITHWMPLPPRPQPPATDAHVAIGSTRFSDGAVQTEASLAEAQGARLVTADFPIIAMGHGKVEVGDGTWEGLPVLWFGNEGQGLGFERERGHGLPIKDRETLVMFTFANIQGLEAIEAAVSRLRATIAPAAVKSLARGIASPEGIEPGTGSTAQPPEPGPAGARPSKGFLKGESPQATWPFAQDDKGTTG